jgi:hypothetical protein
MRPARVLSLATVVAVGAESLACGGPRDPGIAKKEHGRTLMFVPDGDGDQVVDDDTCGDLDEIGFTLPLVLADVFALEGDDEGESMLVTWCDADYNCVVGDPEVTLDAEGLSYEGSTTASVPFSGWEGCDAVEIDLAYAIEDDGESIEVTRDVIVTVPEGGTCPELEAFVRGVSANDKGLDGCAIFGSFDADYIARCKLGDNTKSCITSGDADD